MIGAWLVLAVLLGQAGPDVVFLKNGERVEGQIVEASPSMGVTLRLPDGHTRWFHPLSVVRIERASVTPQAQPVAPPPPVLPTRPVPSDPGAPLPPAAPPVFEPLPPGPPPHAQYWIAVALAGARPFGSSARGAPSLPSLVGPDHGQLSLEGARRLDERLSVGILFDFSFGDVGEALKPVCTKYGTECSTATAQLGLFVRRDFGETSIGTPWVSYGVAREWLNGEVFAPYGGSSTSVPVLSAPGWQFARLGAGIDLRVGPWFSLGLYATYAAGVYERVTIDGVDADTGAAVHAWGQLGIRGTFGR